MEPTKSVIPLLGGIVVLIVIGVGLYFYLNKAPRAPVEDETQAIETGPDVGAEISGAVETPAEKLPQTNPFSGYKNPFE